MLGRVLVPLEGSADAESVLPWLGAWELESTLILLHCIPSRLSKESPSPTRFETPERAREYLEGVGRTIPGATEIAVHSGSAGDGIVAAALQSEAGLVVLGCSGDFGAPRTLGAVNEIVARTCPRPVLIVKTPARPARRRVRRILAPLNAGSHGDENLAVLRGVALALRAEVILLHVSSIEGEDAGSRRSEGSPSYSDVQLNLIRQVWSFLKDGIAARTVMTKGSFVEETAAHEQSLDVDVVAVPRESRPGEAPWTAIVGQCERAVLLYDPREETMPPAPARVGALTTPRA